MTAAGDHKVTPELRGPAERSEPCPVPWPGLPAETNRCVFPYGHEVHWNGAGNVWLSDLAAADAAGYRRAVDEFAARFEAEADRIAAIRKARSAAVSYNEAVAVGLVAAARMMRDQDAASTQPYEPQSDVEAVPQASPTVETPEAVRGIHTPYTDDGLTYCGWYVGPGVPIVDGCGAAWPCPTVQARRGPRTEVRDV